MKTAAHRHRIGGIGLFKILIAEDDRELRQLFAHVLTKNGYTVLGVSNGEEALDALEQSYYDLIISDIMMPKMDGYELVRSIRESGSSIPIMMITAKDAFDDMRLGFLSGSDDYMVKPINIGEMVLRVSALLRRAQMASERRQVIGGTVMECDSLSVTVDGESMVLPQKEFMLLYKMASFPGRIFTRQQLMDDIWGYDSSTDTHTVDVHIARLRERFRDNPDFKIVTMRGGLIRMRLIEEDGSVLFTIDNEGKSIPDEDKSRIFNKFYQGDSSHESEGNGLGLALVRKIVAIHGGEVWVEDPVNGGCRFAVRLPVEK